MTKRSEMNRQDWLALKDRALGAAAEGITIADARLPERPLIYVNEGFERLTGYGADEVLGTNCRFLQGADSDPAVVDEIRSALVEERETTVEILNYRKDGTPFWNRLSITPVRDEDGRLTHFIGVQSDVTKRRRAEEALRRANAIMRHELVEAAEIQRSWLPRSMPQAPGYCFAWSFTPCTELGGDSLNVLRLDQDHVAMYVLDVTGHGVGAALLSASIQRWLSPVPAHSCLFSRDSDENGEDTWRVASPAVVAAELNRRFSSEPETGKFFTLVYGVLDLRNGEFRFTTAGHPPPLRCGPTGAEECDPATGVPIGVLEEFAFGEGCVQLDRGDRLLLYTDGAVETVDAADQLFGAERLLAGLARRQSQDPDTALAEVLSDLKKWAGADSLDDDVTFLMVEATG